MKRLRHIVALFAAFCSLNVDAALVTEIWQGQVGAVSNTTAYSIGDVVSWTVTFDDSMSGQMAIYSDGPNGVSNSGATDDTLHMLFCIDPSSAIACDSSSTSADGFFRFHETLSDISSVYDRMVASLGTDQTVYDYWDTNRDNRSFRNVPWGVLEQYDYRADDFRFAADNYPFRCVYDCPNSGDGSFALTYLDGQGELQFAEVVLTRVSYDSISAVPVPATALLFASALGLFGYLGKRKAVDR